MTCSDIEEYITDTCEEIRQCSGIQIAYADDEISIDDTVIYAGSALKCGYVIAGMYIMAKLLNKETDNDTDQ